MIYLLGGPPRSKKTTVAEVLAAREGVPFIGTDAIAFVLERAAPELGISLGTAHDVRQLALLPFVRALIEAQTLTTPRYLIEGEAIEPSHVPELAAAFEIRACFVGYRSVTIEELVIKRPTWVDHIDDDARAVLPQQLVDRSRAIEAECDRLGLTYVDVSGDHDAAVSRVVDALLG